MRMRRRKNDRSKWLLAGLVPVALAAVYQSIRAFLRKRRPDHWTKPDPGATNFEGAFARIEPGQVPVTAQRKKKTAGKPGTARVYHAPPALHVPSGEPVPERGRFPWLLASALVVILLGFTVYSMLGSRPARTQVAAVPGGDVEAGRQAIQSWGCGSCHTIPGVPGAYGKVGPKLEQMAEQTYIAGMLPNNPDNLIRWIMDPQEIQPGNAMPDTGVTETMARNMAAYLYSIR